MPKPSPISCLVLAAGKGTRMKSALPKVLHPVLGRPMGHWPVAAAYSLDAESVVVVVGHEAELVEESLQSAFPGVKTALQAEQKGTGHAAQVALPSIEGFSGTVLILYGDTPLLTEERMSALCALRDEAEAAVAMLTFRLEDPTGYGRIVRNDAGEVLRIVEHKDASEAERAITEVNPGIYAADADFLRAALEELKNDNAQGEYYLTDIVAAAVDKGGVATLEVPREETLGVNDRTQLAEATEVLRRRMLQAHMLAGVTIEDPTRTWIEADVEIGADTIIAPGTELRGKTRIGAQVRIATGCVITDSVVEDGATLHPYSVLEEASVGPEATVGPFARLRPAARMERGSKIGNFVEMKKATLGEGAKANHLAYLGDATIGAGSNVGAGTITCNYDGTGKHPTVLGEGVFIGSNSTLVAPLNIADGAYVGAGSTVSRDVPADALAISRARQENKEGYAARIRKRNAARKKAMAEAKK